eukprot:TRINITY_DN7038_c0_g1_i1.p1 TRINITY_DN7038_c0_g1~~TRINITY_DN7038_c0_g1_i1.p1  ORF type:complete len:1151 (-),score=150.94 TRINITY_DN7038_c0_g1_i1:272-3724(-)
MLESLGSHRDMKAKPGLFWKESFWDLYKMSALQNSAEENLRQLSESVATVALFGEKRVGKSSLGNCLLGARVFPTGNECTTSVPFHVISGHVPEDASLTDFPTSAKGFGFSYRFNHEIKTAEALSMKWNYVISKVSDPSNSETQTDGQTAQMASAIAVLKSLEPTYVTLMQHYLNFNVNSPGFRPAPFPDSVLGDSTTLSNILTPPLATARLNPLIMSFHLTSPIFGVERSGIALSDSPGLGESSLLDRLALNTIAAASVVVYVYNNDSSFADNMNIKELWNQIRLGKPVICVFNTHSLDLTQLSEKEKLDMYNRKSGELKALLSLRNDPSASPNAHLVDPEFIRARIPVDQTSSSSEVNSIRIAVIRALSNVVQTSTTSALQAYHNLVSAVLLFSSRFAENIMHSAMERARLPDTTWNKRKSRFTELAATAKRLNEQISAVLAEASNRISKINADFDAILWSAIKGEGHNIDGMTGQSLAVLTAYDENDPKSQERYAEELRSRLWDMVQKRLRMEAHAFRMKHCVTFANWLADQVESIEKEIKALQLRNLRMLAESEAHLCVAVESELGAVNKPEIDFRWMLGSGAAVSVAGAGTVVVLFMAGVVVSAAVAAAFAAPLTLIGVGLAASYAFSGKKNKTREQFHNDVCAEVKREMDSWYRNKAETSAFRKAALGDLEKIVEQIFAALSLRVHQAEGFANSSASSGTTDDLILTLWIRDAAMRFERDISREVQSINGAPTWKAVVHHPTGNDCRACGANIQRCGHLCRLCDTLFFKHSCPYCHVQEETNTISSTEIQGQNPLIQHSNETYQVMPELTNILRDIASRCSPEPSTPTDELSNSRFLSDSSKSILERLLSDSPASVLARHIRQRFSADLVSFATRFVDVKWSEKSGRDHSQLARCSNLVIRAMYAALQSKISQDRSARTPQDSRNSIAIDRISYTERKKLICACIQALFDTPLPGSGSERSLGQYIFDFYNQFKPFQELNLFWTRWARGQLQHDDFKKLEKTFGSGDQEQVWLPLVNKLVSALKSARSPWDLFQAYNALPEDVLDFARARAESDPKLMEKLMDNPLGADDLWLAYERCLINSGLPNMGSLLKLTSHFLVDYPPAFLEREDEQMLCFISGITGRLSNLVETSELTFKHNQYNSNE